MFSSSKEELYIPAYLKNTYQYQIWTKITEVDNNEEWVVFDDTIFHPQGGGQPKDHGFCSIPGGTSFKILEAKWDLDSGKVEFILR